MDEAYWVKAAFLKSMAHPIRLQILELLSQGERGVGAISQAVGLDGAVVSRHLGILKQGGAVMSRQEGASVYYRIHHEETIGLLRNLRELLKRRLEIDRELLKSFE